jgi:hypothetical protein
VIKISEPHARREYEQLMAEVVSEAEGTGDRARLMADKIHDAIQAQRSWAAGVQFAAEIDGYAAAVKAYLKRTRVVVIVDQDREISKPRTIGVKRRDKDGTVVDLQLPMEVLTFDQLREKRREYIRQLKAYTDNVAVADRLLALEEMAPGSSTPTEAAAQLGVTLDDYLAGAA